MILTSFIFIFIILLPSASHAYIDPGTGGMLFQIGFAVFSVVLSWLFVPYRVFKNAWLRLKSRFKKHP